MKVLIEAKTKEANETQIKLNEMTEERDSAAKMIRALQKELELQENHFNK